MSSASAPSSGARANFFDSESSKTLILRSTVNIFGNFRSFSIILILRNKVNECHNNFMAPSIDLGHILCCIAAMLHCCIFPTLRIQQQCSKCHPRDPQIGAQCSIKIVEHCEIKMFCTTIYPRCLGSSLDTIPSFCLM